MIRWCGLRGGDQVVRGKGWRSGGEGEGVKIRWRGERGGDQVVKGKGWRSGGERGRKLRKGWYCTSIRW